jgi:hypothetical protein
MGLGLSLSKDFIERGHDGVIGVRSPGDLNIGSTFYFKVTLPVVVETDYNLRPTYSMDKHTYRPEQVILTTADQ